MKKHLISAILCLIAHTAHADWIKQNTDSDSLVAVNPIFYGDDACTAYDYSDDLENHPAMLAANADPENPELTDEERALIGLFVIVDGDVPDSVKTILNFSYHGATVPCP